VICYTVQPSVICYTVQPSVICYTVQPSVICYTVQPSLLYSIMLYDVSFGLQIRFAWFKFRHNMYKFKYSRNYWILNWKPLQISFVCYCLLLFTPLLYPCDTCSLPCCLHCVIYRLFPSLLLWWYVEKERNKRITNLD